MPERHESRGSGFSLDDPYRLPATHPILGVASQKMLISRLFGEQDKDWFDDGRTHHPNKIREQQIRLRSGQIRRVFFDESELDYAIPIPEEVQDAVHKAAANIPVPDVQLVSRFPLIEVKASTAAEAGRIIVTHLNKAKEQGWVRGHADLFVDGWRNDYYLTKGSEETVMSFDLRPASIADSTLNLMMFSSLNSLEGVDEVARRMEAMKKPATNIIEIDPRRIFVLNTRFASIAALVGGMVGFFVSHSFAAAFGIAAVAFGVTFAWCRNALREEAASRGIELRVRGESVSAFGGQDSHHQAVKEKQLARDSADGTVRPDTALAAVIGSTPRSRTDVTKALWDYINRHGLQDEKKRTTIHADEKLLPIFHGKKTVTMLEMVKFVSRHLHNV